MINDRITINRYINIHTDTSTSTHADQNERRGARRSDDEVLSECALASCDALVEHNQERVSSLKTPPLELRKRAVNTPNQKMNKMLALRPLRLTCFSCVKQQQLAHPISRNALHH